MSAACRYRLKLAEVYVVITNDFRMDPLDSAEIMGRLRAKLAASASAIMTIEPRENSGPRYGASKQAAPPLERLSRAIPWQAPASSSTIAAK